MQVDIIVKPYKRGLNDNRSYIQKETFQMLKNHDTLSPQLDSLLSIGQDSDLDPLRTLWVD